MSGPDLSALPRLPCDADGPIFAEPWQAQAFALALDLHARGAFTWPEWAQTLSAELSTNPADDGSRYYDHWVAALERLVTERHMTSAPELAVRKAAWDHAYRTTPHGRPVSL